MKKALRVLMFLAAFALVMTMTASAKPDSRLARIFKTLGLEYTINDYDNYVVEVFNGERVQYVIVESETETYEGVEIREIWSMAGYFSDYPDEDTLYTFLLDSGTYKIGAWAVEEAEDGWYVYFVVKIPIETTPASLGVFIQFVGEVADDQESVFTGDDEF